MVSGALFAIAPALEKPRSAILTGRSVSSISHAMVRQWLVVSQIAACMVLLAGAMALASQL